MFTIATRIVLSLCLCVMLAAKPALAEPDIPSVSVRTIGLDLATPAGKQALHSRIVRAVRSVCGDADLLDLRAMMEQHACRAIAMSKAFPQMQVAITHGQARHAYSAINAQADTPAS